MNHTCIARARVRVAPARGPGIPIRVLLRTFPLTAALMILGIGTSTAVHAEEASDELIEEVVVVGHPLSAEGLALPATVITAEELESMAADSIGATVANEPGIHNSSFAAAAGRPVIHGLGGARVRVMEDRIDTLDVSVTSGDHAVTVDPFIAERVEVLKGSGTCCTAPAPSAAWSTSTPDASRTKCLSGSVASSTCAAPTTATARTGPSGSTGAAGAWRGTWTASPTRRTTTTSPGSSSPRTCMLWKRWKSTTTRTSTAPTITTRRTTTTTTKTRTSITTKTNTRTSTRTKRKSAAICPAAASTCAAVPSASPFVGDRGFIGVSVSGLNSDYGIPGHSHAHGHEEDEHGHDEDDHELGHDDEDDHDEEHGDDHDDDEEHADDHDEEEEEHHDEHEDEHADEGVPVIELQQTRIDLEGRAGRSVRGFREPQRPRRHQRLRAPGDRALRRGWARPSKTKPGKRARS